MSAKVSKAVSSKSVNALSQESPGSSSDEFDEEVSQERLEAIPDEDEAVDDYKRSHSLSKYGMQQSSTIQSTSGQKAAMRYDSETPSLVQDKGASPTPSTEGSVGYSAYHTTGISRLKRSTFSSPPNPDTLRSDWSHLPLDLQFYLTYFYENITHLHYSLKFDSANFLRTTFLDAALRNESLLYAVVGFSAFQRTLHNTDGKIQDFLQYVVRAVYCPEAYKSSMPPKPLLIHSFCRYYNKAVWLLLNSLKRGERHTNGTILAILQLATIEVSIEFTSAYSQS